MNTTKQLENNNSSWGNNLSSWWMHTNKVKKGADNAFCTRVTRFV